MESTSPAHTFPVPEPEAHKLDNVTEQIRHQPWRMKVRDFGRANAWPCVLCAFGFGLMIGAAVKMFR